jgi:DNA repair exonuclease SbcCD ATPase subunit
VSARQKVSEEQGKSRSAITSKFGDMSVGQLNEKLLQLQREATVLQRDIIEPLRRSSIETVRANSQRVWTIDQGISAVREKLAITKAAFNASSTAKASLSTRLQQQEQQRQVNTTTFKSLLLSTNLTALSDDLLSTNIDINALRREHEASLASLAQVNSQVSALQTALMRLNEVKTGKTSCAAHDADNCPVCGQVFPENTAKQRESQLIIDIHHLKQEQGVWNRTCEALRGRVDMGLKAKSMAEQLRQLQDRVRDLQGEITAHEAVASVKLQELNELEKELVERVSVRKSAEASHSVAELETVNQLKLQEQLLQDLLAQEKALKATIDELNRIENELNNKETRANATLTLIEDRLKSAYESVQTKSIPLFELEDIVSRGNREKKDIAARAAVYSRLGDCLGPRGIQHFIFLGLLRQLEEIANSYLDILADGGIRLALQGDDDGDRIIKTVSIRGVDGRYTERGLSQLSGGQWRRVSMSLDFAFAEVIRRKGTLRSNLMVMDEVLTHLDATGREAVGTVLRAMVGPTVTKTKKSVAKGVVTESVAPKEDEFGIEVTDGFGTLVTSEKRPELGMELSLLSAGSYETVLVILQDLVAQEFEESFDHIDTVVKAGDSSTVEIDGVEGQ